MPDSVLDAESTPLENHAAQAPAPEPDAPVSEDPVSEDPVSEDPGPEASAPTAPVSEAASAAVAPDPAETATPEPQPAEAAQVPAEAAPEPQPAEDAAQVPAEAAAEPQPAEDAAQVPAEAAPEPQPAEDAAAAEAEPGEAPPAEAPAAAEAKAEEPPAAEAAAGKVEAEPVEEPEEIKALRAAKESGETVQGKVIGWNRGGFHVALDNGITAFCPNSEMEAGRPKAAAGYVDQTLDFQVLKVQRRGRRVVLSRSSLLKEQREELAAATRAKLTVGAVLSGRVSSVTDFGAFIDLGGVEGLVHVSEISRQRVGHAKQAVQLGQEVEVKVLKIEKGGERISLSMKALEPDPWDGVAERFAAGSEFSGKIVRKTDFGLFVELEPDVDGLVHVSRLPHGTGLDNETLQVGNKITGWVQEVDTRRGRISLSLREVPQGDPWKGIEERLSEGSVVDGTVESVAPFGVFINLEPGLTGLLPGSETGVPRGTSASRQYRPGQTVSVQVMTIDRRRKRISLAREGSTIEGSKADYQAYRQQTEASSQGLSQLASAFAKLREGQPDSDSSDSE